MDFLVVIAVVIFVINMVGKANKTKRSAPGRTPPPAGGGQSAARPEQAAPGSLSEAMRELFGEAVVPAAPARPAAPAPKLDEGASVTCPDGDIGGSMPHADHQGKSVICAAGDIGGSMPHTTHQGQGNAPKRAVPPAISLGASAEPALVSPSMINAEEMRRAVVMAEVLKRPCERRGGHSFR